MLTEQMQYFPFFNLTDLLVHLDLVQNLSFDGSENAVVRSDMVLAYIIFNFKLCINIIVVSPGVQLEGEREDYVSPTLF